jgi:hypothetical protein
MPAIVSVRCGTSAVGEGLGVGLKSEIPVGVAVGVGVGVGDGVGDGEPDAEGDGEGVTTANCTVQENPWSCGQRTPCAASLTAYVTVLPGGIVGVVDACGETPIAFGMELAGICALTGGATPPGADVPPLPKLP